MKRLLTKLIKHDIFYYSGLEIDEIIKTLNYYKDMNKHMQKIYLEIEDEDGEYSINLYGQHLESTAEYNLRKNHEQKIESQKEQSDFREYIMLKNKFENGQDITPIKLIESEWNKYKESKK